MRCDINGAEFYIIKPQEDARWRVMICQACGLGKKKSYQNDTTFLANNYNFDTNYHLNERLNFSKKFNASFVAPTVSEYPLLFNNRVKGPA